MITAIITRCFSLSERRNSRLKNFPEPAFKLARVSAGRMILIDLTVIVLIILGLAFCQTLSREDVYAAEIVGYLNDQAYGDFDHRLIIPKNCKATLDMQGRIFDRRLSRTNDWAANGELICIRTGATLTINGHIGDHDAGCIHVESNTTLTLNDVTIAGCRTEPESSFIRRRSRLRSPGPERSKSMSASVSNHRTSRSRPSLRRVL